MRKLIHCIHDKKTVCVCESGHTQLHIYLLILLAAFLASLLAWSYWPTFKALSILWHDNDDNSVGLLVPIAALFLLWRERKLLKDYQLIPCWWAGIAVLLVAQFIRIFGLLTFRFSPQCYSMVLMIAGVVLMTAGKQVFKKVFWILLFLFLMVPLPGRVQTLASVPLQNLATKGTVFVLEAFSVEVVREGNIITLNGTIPMGVAEACNGLRMLTSFIIVTAFITYLAKCSRSRKAVLMLSSIPIALICNIIRLFLTAAAMMIISVEAGQKFFHDFAGLLMMPIAVLLLFAELWIMDKINEPQTGRKNEKKVLKSSKSIHKTKPVKSNNRKTPEKVVVAKD